VVWDEIRLSPEVFIETPQFVVLFDPARICPSFYLFASRELSAATHCNTLQHTATHCNTLQRTATHCTAPLTRTVIIVCLPPATWALQHTATYCNTLHCTTNKDYHHSVFTPSELGTAAQCNTLQRTATHCNALQRTATHCNTLRCTTDKDIIFSLPRTNGLYIHVSELCVCKERRGGGA